ALDMPYGRRLTPLARLLVAGVAFLVMLIVVVAGQNIEAVADGRVLEVASAYIGLPIFLLVWGLHRLITGPRSRFISLQDVDVDGLEITPKA
ncbi:hypothetical protein KC218_20840, partial [Mycobacterium tuberculosis]|nr:hypothetical protein [Mycobacterium tuberculosis]